MHTDVYESIWLKLDIMIDTGDVSYFDGSLFDLDLDWRSQKCEKAELVCQLGWFSKFSMGFDGIWYGVETYWFDGYHTDVI